MTRPLPPPCSGWICWKKRSGLAEPLSGGERQRAYRGALAQTPYRNLLDEPTNHLTFTIRCS